MSSIVNKVKDALHSDKKHEQPEGTSGPHANRAANAADPRVDSDRDHRANPAGTTGTHTTGTHTGTTGSGLTGTHGTTGTTGTSGLTGSNTTTGYNDPDGVHGPHSGRMANKADPRVDSDRDHRGAPGSGLTGSTGTHGTTTGSGLTGSTGTHGTTGSGLTGTHGTTGTTTGSGLTGTHGTTGTTTGSGMHSGLSGSHNNSNVTTGYNDPDGVHGPHSGRMANKADPRVDSDRDHRGAPGSGLTGSTGTHGTTGSGLTGSHGTSATHNTHGNSSLTGNPNTGATGGVSNTHNAAGHVGSSVAGTHGTGPAPNTAGPHKSDALNKADPRVDSDLDGSKTVGGNKTYAQDTTSGVAKDPTDASQVPPSVLAKHIGEPEIAHDDHAHGRARRNSKVSAQEMHHGM